MPKTTEAERKAIAKYKAKTYKRVPLDLKKDEYEALIAYTKKTGESVNGCIRRLIKEAIEKY